MTRSVVAGLLLFVLFLGLALIVVMFAVLPTYSDLTEGPAARPLLVTLPPGSAQAAADLPQGTPGAAPTRSRAVAMATFTPEPTAAARAKALIKERAEAPEGRYRFTTWAIYGIEDISLSAKPVTLRIDGEVDGANSRQVLTTVEQAGDPRYSQLEMRVVDGVSYFYADGKWQASAAAQAGQQQFFSDPASFLDATGSLTFVTIEELPDLPVLTYRYEFETAAGDVTMAIPSLNLPQQTPRAVEAQQSGKLWIGADGRRYQVEYRVRFGGAQYGMVLSWELTTRYFDYDDPTIHVEAPQGVAPSGQ
jgi:hypothetical protein